MEKKELTEEELAGITGGADGWQGLFEGPWKKVCNLTSGYLALRTAPLDDESNEIGVLYNGCEVQIIGNESDNGYIWVYSPTLNMSGWIKSFFIG